MRSPLLIAGLVLILSGSALALIGALNGGSKVQVALFVFPFPIPVILIFGGLIALVALILLLVIAISLLRSGRAS